VLLFDSSGLGGATEPFSVSVLGDEGVIFLDVTADGNLLDTPGATTFQAYRRTFEKLRDASLAETTSAELIKSLR